MNLLRLSFTSFLRSQMRRTFGRFATNHLACRVQPWVAPAAAVSAPISSSQAQPRRQFPTFSQKAQSKRERPAAVSANGGLRGSLATRRKRR